MLGPVLLIVAGVLISLLDGPLPFADLIGFPLAGAGVIALIDRFTRS